MRRMFIRYEVEMLHRGPFFFGGPRQLPSLPTCKSGPGQRHCNRRNPRKRATVPMLPLCKFIVSVACLSLFRISIRSVIKRFSITFSKIKMAKDGIGNTKIPFPVHPNVTSNTLSYTANQTTTPALNAAVTAAKPSSNPASAYRWVRALPVRAVLLHPT